MNEHNFKLKKLRISKHARKRLIERYNIDSKNVYNVVKLARKVGLYEKDMSEKLKKYIGFLYTRRSSNDFVKIIIYNYFVFIFLGHYNLLITVFQLPDGLKEEFEKSLKYKEIRLKKNLRQESR